MKVNFVTGEGPDAKVSRLTFWKPINVKVLT